MSQIIKKILYISLFIMVLLFGLLFFVKNYQLLEFNYLIGMIELPLSVLMLVSFFAGVLTGICALIPWLVRMKHRQSRLTRQLKLNEKEITNLRVLPARDSD